MLWLVPPVAVALFWLAGSLRAQKPDVRFGSLVAPIELAARGGRLVDATLGTPVELAGVTLPLLCTFSEQMVTELIAEGAELHLAGPNAEVERS